jgi:hypothetical protein
VGVLVEEAWSGWSEAESRDEFRPGFYFVPSGVRAIISFYTTANLEV